MLFMLAQAAESVEDPSLLIQLITSWGLIILIGGAIFFAFRGAHKKNKQVYAESHQHLARSQQHMDNLEAKTDRMIELLEQIRDGSSKDAP